LGERARIGNDERRFVTSETAEIDLGIGIGLVAFVQKVARAQSLAQIVQRIQKTPPAVFRVQGDLVLVRRLRGHDRGSTFLKLTRLRGTVSRPKRKLKQRRARTASDLGAFAAAQAAGEIVYEGSRRVLKGRQIDVVGRLACE
jgi:hypothetical protein